MLRRGRSTRLNAWIEEAGKGQQVYVEFELHGELDPGEPMVRYYPDGSGYPGSLPYVEYHSCFVTRIIGENYDYKRRDRPDYFELLDKIVDRIVMADLDHYERWMLEDFCEMEIDDRW